MMVIAPAGIDAGPPHERFELALSWVARALVAAYNDLP